METLQSRPGGVYRDDPAKPLYACPEFAADGSAASITESLAEISDQVGLAALYAMQALTLVAAIMFAVVMARTDAWMAFAAAGVAVAFLTVAASAGFYIIAVKTGAAGERQ
ncbi:MAG TPA: hypothetical protein VJ718_04325 [Candidatus Binataceae bacterium]|nr:hypothetical protein [Candidatus Binataceae bacterium]